MTNNEFQCNNKYEYQYQVSIRKDKIVAESLYRKALMETSRYALVFERTGSKNIKLHGSLKNYNVTDISDTLTLISYFGITHRRNGIIKDIVNWFDSGIDFIFSVKENKLNHCILRGLKMQ